MEISPYMLMLLLIYSFFFGMSAGAFNDINRIIRAFLGVRYSKYSFDDLYLKKLPIVRKPLERKELTQVKERLLSVIIFAQDVFLFIYLGCGVVVLNYYLNRGQFRLYTIAAAIAGFAIYYFTIGKIVILASEVIIFFIRAVFKVVFFVIFHPILLMFKKIFKAIKKIRIKIKTSLAKKRNIRYNENKQKELEALARRGFFD